MMNYLDKELSWNDFINSERNWNELIRNAKRFTDFLTHEQMVKNGISKRFHLLCSQVIGIESQDNDEQELLHGRIIDFCNDVYEIVHNENDLSDDSKDDEAYSNTDLSAFNWDDFLKTLYELFSIIIEVLIQFLFPIFSMVQKVITAVQKVDLSDIDPVKSERFFSTRADQMFSEYVTPVSQNDRSFEMRD